MKRSFIIVCTLLLCAISLKATLIEPAKDSNYWVTETGPRSNPYTVIRIYDEEHNQLLEILMKGYRLRIHRPAMIERLNALADAANADAAGIAAVLGIKTRRVTSVKKTNE